MSGPTITLADRDDRDAVVATVVAAFRRDPAFTWFFPQDYDRQAAAFAGLLFDTRVATSSIWVADGGDAVAMWDRPRAVDSGREDDLEGALARSVPPDAIDRIAQYEAVVDALLPEQPHWYLGILATHPDRAGHRLGRTVGRVGLDEATRAGRPAALETTNVRNVERYEAEGWTVSGYVDIESLHVWVLRHGGTD